MICQHCKELEIELVRKCKHKAMASTAPGRQDLSRQREEEEHAGVVGGEITLRQTQQT